MPSLVRGVNLPLSPDQALGSFLDLGKECEGVRVRRTPWYVLKVLHNPTDRLAQRLSGLSCSVMLLSHS